MTFWKVDYRTPNSSSPLTRWFRNSRDAIVFCDSIPGGFYDTNYYCREVNIPNNILAAVERHWLASSMPASVPPVPAVVADQTDSYRLAS
jgi:hypothetical protein